MNAVPKLSPPTATAPLGKLILMVTALIALMLLQPSGAQAQSMGGGSNDTWTGGSSSSSNWNDSGNWSTQPSNYGNLIFQGSSRTTNVDNQSYSENTIFFEGSSAWSVTASGGSTISLYDYSGYQPIIAETGAGGVTLGSGVNITMFAATANPWGEVDATDSNITFAAGSTLTISTNTAGLRIFGGSTETTSFNGTYNGSNATNGGTGNKYFAIIGQGSNGTQVSIGGTFASGDIYDMNGSTLSLSGNGLTTTALRMGGDLGTTGFENLTKGATFDLVDSGGGQTFSSTINPVTGNTSGALVINSENISGTNGLSGGIYLDSSLAINQNLGGTLNLSNTVDVKGNILTLNGGASPGTIDATTAISDDGDGGEVNIGTGAGGGGGLVIFGAANTYSGQTDIDTGTLRVDVAPATTSGTFFVGNGNSGYTASPATLVLGGAGGTGGGVTFSDPISVNPGNGTDRYIGGLNTTGTNTFAGTVSLTGVFGENRYVNITAATGGTVAFTNVISGAGQGITKIGGGTAIFSAQETYTGSTTISAGTLELTNAGTAGNSNGGTLAGGGATTVTVNSTGTMLLGASNALGTGTPIYLNGGTFKVGNGSYSEGTAAHITGAAFNSSTLAATGGSPSGDSNVQGMDNLTLSGSSTLTFGNTASTEVFGTFTPNGNTLNITNYTSSANILDGVSGTDNTDDRLIFDAGSSGLGAALADITFNGVSDAGEIQLGNASSAYWEVGVIPEPTTVFGALALVGFLGYRERRRLSRLIGSVTIFA